MFDEVLRLKFPAEVKIVSFAYDITPEVYGESIDEVELTTAHSIAAIKEAMSFRKRVLPPQKNGGC